jgi:heme exporter protein D
MQDDCVFLAQAAFEVEKVLLWLAIGITTVFLGLLVFDLLRRRRRARRRRRSEPEPLRDRLFKPILHARTFYSDLESMLRERSRRQRRHRRHPPQPPR